MRKIVKSNFRVEVYPKTTCCGISVAAEENICKEMVAEINRHVNNAQSASIVSDKDPVCSSCGRQWTEDGDAYNGGCCKADQEAEDARTANSVNHMTSASGAPQTKEQTNAND